MKKTLLLNVVLIACLIGGAVSSRAEDEKSASKPDKGQQPAPQKTNAPSRPTNSQNDTATKPKSGKGEKPDSKGKVSINHKGRVISVDEHAVKDHLAHGDTVVSENASSKPDDKSKEGGKSKDKDKDKDKGR